MTQLIKHYWINRDTGGWAIDTPYGLMMPNIRGLETKHSLFTQEKVPFFLSEVPDYFEYEVTVSQEQLTEYQNNSNITIISSTEKQIEVPVFDLPGVESTGETRTETVYDVVYRESYILEESEGLQILTQQEWDAEISTFDSHRTEDRYDILREIRDRILELTDWMVIKDLEQSGSVSAEFKTWRQNLRNLPNSQTFPTGFPTLPTELQGHSEISSLYSRFDEVRSIPMIHDPLSNS
jgi:hypothetical protein